MEASQELVVALVGTIAALRVVALAVLAVVTATHHLVVILLVHQVIAALPVAIALVAVVQIRENTMRVKELIELLQKMPQDLEVLTNDEYGYFPKVPKESFTITICLNTK